MRGRFIMAAISLQRIVPSPGDVVNAARTKFQTPRKGENQIVFMEELHGRIGVGDSGQERLSERLGNEVVGAGAYDGAYAQDGQGGLRVAFRELEQARFGGGLVLAVLESFSPDVRGVRLRARNVGVVGVSAIYGGTAEVDDMPDSRRFAGLQHVICPSDIHPAGVGFAASRVQDVGEVNHGVNSMTRKDVRAGLGDVPDARTLLCLRAVRLGA